MSSSLIKAGALALACASTVSATLKYTLAPEDTYEGGDFFEKFDFKAIVDPTAGYVQYQSKQSAESNAFGTPLVKYENGQAYMGVDYQNKYDPNGVGRPSVRIESQKQYNYGLFVLDIAHMPENVCGTWPAFWTFNELDYPKWGEIDILENINEQTQTLETLHTTPTCSVAGNHFSLQELGQQTTYNCDDQATTGPFGTTQYQYQGCSAVNTSPNNYGKALNAAGGAVYVMEWTKDAISVWNFQPGNVPTNLVAGNPDTSSWGLPQFTTAQGDCDIDSHFKDHKVVLDTTFCGSWAGLPEMWSQTSCYDAVKYPRCQDYVAAHPEAYAGAYWLFNSMKVYQKTEVVSSTSSSR
ncbi:concanavalin A-like lectin/glucanase domain-containing protein [Tricladium varicosporioides]|nr:concanavalin A-like lectin/glucanase domain-containing protein [Hymenoscyphus varicosporioides]